MEEVDKEDVSTLATTQTSLEKALINVIDCLTSEEEEDLRACLEDLDHEDNIPVGGIGFEELKSRIPSEKTKVELKTNVGGTSIFTRLACSISSVESFQKSLNNDLIIIMQLFKRKQQKIT